MPIPRLPSEDTWISVALFNGDCFPRPFGEQIALAVGEIKGCNYCLATNTTIGEMIGLSEQELLDSRSGEAGDKKSRATLSFARHLVVERGAVADDVLAEARDAGLSDGELAEMVARVALNTYTNYFNRLGQTDLDFPAAPDGRPRRPARGGMIREKEKRRFNE